MASIEIGNCIIEHNLKTGRFDLYKKGVGVIDKAITDELKRLNVIEEFRPANRNSILESKLAKITRELLGKEK